MGFTIACFFVNHHHLCLPNGRTNPKEVVAAQWRKHWCNSVTFKDWMLRWHTKTRWISYVINNQIGFQWFIRSLWLATFIWSLWWSVQGAAQGMNSISIVLPELIDVSGEDHGHVSLTGCTRESSLKHNKAQAGRYGGLSLSLDHYDMDDCEASAPREQRCAPPKNYQIHKFTHL